MTKPDKQKHPLVIVHDYLYARIDELKILPATIAPERFLTVAMTAVRLNQDLLACDRQSIWIACLRAASDGLLPDGREGAIVPFKDKAQWMPMVGGLLKRFRNSGQFKSLDVDVVREGEQFSYFKDEHGPHLHHVPGDGSGKLIKAYATAQTIDGGIMVEVMSENEINKRRNVSRSKNSPLWTEWVEEAWQKTVLRNLAKRLPMSSDLYDLAQRGDDAEFTNPEPPRADVKRIAGVTEALDAFGGEEKQPTTEQGAELADEMTGGAE